jgi:CheY-like chemotaxis protein
VLLVVDDEAAPRSVTARMLMTAGYLVLTAASGDEALRILRDNPSRAVQLVIADLSMPAMGGVELANRGTQAVKRANATMNAVTWLAGSSTGLANGHSRQQEKSQALAAHLANTTISAGH